MKLIAVLILAKASQLTSDEDASSDYYAYLGSFPYVVSVQFKDLSKFCTGVITRKTSVLTSCDCVSNYNEKTRTFTKVNESDIFVVAGVLDMFTDMLNAQLRTVIKIQLHDLCTSRPKDDVNRVNYAAIEVVEPFIFYDKTGEETFVKPMTKMESLNFAKLKRLIIYLTKNNGSCSTVGWGYKDSNNHSSTRLQAIPTLMIINTLCGDQCYVYQKVCLVPYTNQSNVCGSTERYHCGGYTGTLLICGGRVVGILNHPTPCVKDKRIPSVYSRLDVGLTIYHDELNHIPEQNSQRKYFNGHVVLILIFCELHFFVLF